MNKSKVSTKTYSISEKKEKILRVLKQHPEGLSPKYISLYSRLNVNTVKSTLVKMSSVKKKIRGLYVVSNNGDGLNLFEWNFHNTLFQSRLERYSGERVNKTFSFDILNFEFEIGKESKNANLKISTEYPLNFSSLCTCSLLFKLLVKEYSGIEINEKTVMIKCMEFNKDYINLRLDGMKCITLSSLITQYKIYQKKRGLREELRLNVPIEFNHIFESLTSSSKAIEINNRLDNIEKKYSDIEKHYKKISRFIDKTLMGGINYPK